jgi:hypothetical protein
MREQTPEYCRGVAKQILQIPEVIYLEAVLHDQLVEAERDARAKGF